MKTSHPTMDIVNDKETTNDKTLKRMNCTSNFQFHPGHSNKNIGSSRKMNELMQQIEEQYNPCTFLTNSSCQAWHDLLDIGDISPAVISLLVQVKMTVLLL